MDGGDFADIIHDGGYTKVLTDEDRTGILVLQKLKCALGLDHLVDMCAPAADLAATTVSDEEKPEGAATEPSISDATAAGTDTDVDAEMATSAEDADSGKSLEAVQKDAADKDAAPVAETVETAPDPKG